MFLNPSQLIVGIVALLLGATAGISIPDADETLPDLQAYETTLSVGSVHVGGGVVTFTARVENVGTEASPTFRIGGFYIDADLDGEAEYLVPAGIMGEIDPGSVRTAEAVWVVPNDAVLGTYRVGYIADVNVAGGSDVFEQNESNNWSGWTSFLVTASYPVPPNCPYEPRQGRTIINFAERRQLYSSKASWNGGIKETQHYPTNLVPGSYRVRLASWDGYVGRESVTQPREEWRAVVSDGASVIGVSGLVSDIADRVREGYREERVSDNLTISRTGTVVYGEHGWFEDTSDYNSVMPICASFDLMTSTDEEETNDGSDDDNKTTDPLTLQLSACDQSGANCVATPDTKHTGDGEEILISWTSTGATACLRTGGPTDFTVDAVSGVDVSVSEPEAGSEGSYEVTCVNGEGETVKRSVTVVVDAEQPALSANKPRVRLGEPLSLSWNTSSSDPSTCSISGGSLGIEGLAEATGTVEDLLVYGLTTFTLSCEYGQSSVTVELIQTAYES